MQAGHAIKTSAFELPENREASSVVRAIWISTCDDGNHGAALMSTAAIFCPSGMDLGKARARRTIPQIA